jgi:hypothetical protein
MLLGTGVLPTEWITVPSNEADNSSFGRVGWNLRPVTVEKEDQKTDNKI